MRKEIALTHEADECAKQHLLKHYKQGQLQEELCMALWYPSYGKERLTALINEIILPNLGEVNLHGNASFEGSYVTRAIREARKKRAGLVLMHSHPSNGWQGLSHEDEVAERDVLAYQAQATKQPFVGMTLGDDGYWSGRFWVKSTDGMVCEWCNKVRIPCKNRYLINWKPDSVVNRIATEVLKRTIETWGIGVQKDIQRLRIGVVGVGSVGAIVAESLARIGISEITLIDGDSIKLHNLDRFIYGTMNRLGEKKVIRAKTEIAKNSTNPKVKIRAIETGIEYEDAYKEALDCDLLVSCVDKPVARDVLNYIAISNLIPVIEGGIAVDVGHITKTFVSARWRSHIIIPGNACLRCTGQYNSSDVVTELDGSLDDPSYINNLPASERPQNQNVFPFSLGSASMQTNLMIRYLIGENWWPQIQRQEYKFVSGRTRTTKDQCGVHCSFIEKQGYGNHAQPSYLKRDTKPIRIENWTSKLKIWICSLLMKLRP